MVKKVLSLHPSLASRAFKPSPARPWWDVSDQKQKELQTPWEEGTASAMRSFTIQKTQTQVTSSQLCHCIKVQLLCSRLEDSSGTALLPSGAPRSRMWPSPFLAKAPGWTSDPKHNLQTPEPLKLKSKRLCSRSRCKFQSSAETEPRSLIHIQIPNQYFKKIKV